ncbi:phage tail assembly chaperone G [Limosilactobacillus portuensis]|uniref:phage tail assembly chaperone G n=1 Tax=Limosilactobacillus portuensis TaxID=2742601 RepID=UPI003D73192E
MPLELKVKTKGKEATYTRTEEPMLENLLDALKVQRQEIVMYSDSKAVPTDKDNEKLINLRAEFAARFWGKGLTKKDVLSGVSSVEGLKTIEDAIALTLGMSIDDDDEDSKGDKDPKK